MVVVETLTDSVVARCGLLLCATRREGGRSPMRTLDEAEARRLNGIEDWKLEPHQVQFLIESTSKLLEEHGEAFFLEAQERHRLDLKRVFTEFI